MYIYVSMNNNYNIIQWIYGYGEYFFKSVFTAGI